MSNSTPASVVSGVAYPILSVTGRACQDLSDFLDDSRFTIDNGGLYTAKGSGCSDGDHVRFYEKDHDGGGRDIRVWQIVRTPEGTFTAEHVVSV